MRPHKYFAIFGLLPWASIVYMWTYMRNCLLRFAIFLVYITFWKGICFLISFSVRQIHFCAKLWQISYETSFLSKIKKRFWIQHNSTICNKRRISLGLMGRNVPKVWHKETNSRSCFAVSLKLQTLLQGYKRLIPQSVILKPFSLPQRCFWELL